MKMSEHEKMTKVAMIVCELFNVQMSDLKGKRRLREYVKARHAATYNMRKMGCNWQQIGRFLGGRDHSTAIHGYNSWEDWTRYKFEADLQKQIDRKVQYAFSADIKTQIGNLKDQIRWAQKHGHNFMVVPCYKMLNELINLK